LKGGEEVRELTRDEILEILCAPAITDVPDESDFVYSDENAEEDFVKNWITRELN
jgi:hypothetical protein